jgi:ABC-type uncharacterized transport system substrate-binding protein
MKRREFIAFLGSVAVWPVVAHAQQAPKRMMRVSALIGFAEHDPATQRRVAAFLKRLADLGWTLDRNVAIDFRYGAGDAAKNRAFAKERVNLNPDVIFVNSTSATAAVQLSSVRFRHEQTLVRESSPLAKLAHGAHAGAPRHSHLREISAP